MPCNDGGPSLEDIRKADIAMEKKRKQEREYKKRLDLVTRLLCDVLTKLEDKYPKKAWNPLNWGDNNELRSWWEKHKEQDRKRLANEKVAKEQEKKRLQTEIARFQTEIAKLQKELDTI